MGEGFNLCLLLNPSPWERFTDFAGGCGLPGEAHGGFLQHLYLPPEPHSLALFFARRQRGPRLSQLRILSTQQPGNPMQPVA
jgi:hypothetical protein